MRKEEDDGCIVYTVEGAEVKDGGWGVSVLFLMDSVQESIKRETSTGDQLTAGLRVVALPPPPPLL